MPEIEKRGRGRPRKHKPTDETRLKVSTLAGVGVPYEHIATMLGISSDTLVLRYPVELKAGGANWIATATKKLYEAVLRGEAWAIAFTLKCKGGFREKARPDEREPESLLPLPLPTNVPSAAPVALVEDTSDDIDSVLDYMRIMNGDKELPALPALPAPDKATDAAPTV